jgi:16S rRNA (guanine527-N7)-methyltransferase
VTSALLARWLEAVVTAPGITGITNFADAERALLEDALRASPIVEGVPGSVIDVGSGGGTPGIPLATTFPDRAFTLLEAERRKCDFLETVSGGSPTFGSSGGAEEQPPDQYG